MVDVGFWPLQGTSTMVKVTQGKRRGRERGVGLEAIKYYEFFFALKLFKNCVDNVIPICIRLK